MYMSSKVSTKNRYLAETSRVCPATIRLILRSAGLSTLMCNDPLTLLVMA